MNCRNHRLALLFVHFLPKHKSLADADAVTMGIWKLMKYSLVKASLSGAAQEAKGQSRLKLLKAAPTRWLCHEKAAKRLVSQFVPLVNALDIILSAKSSAEVQGIKENLLEPNTILFLLLLTDVLSHANVSQGSYENRILFLEQWLVNLQTLKIHYISFQFQMVPVFKDIQCHC